MRHEVACGSCSHLGSITEQFPGYPGPTGASRRAWARDNEKTQVIDRVWEAEGYKAPPGAPEKYFGLGHLQKAGG